MMMHRSLFGVLLTLNILNLLLARSVQGQNAQLPAGRLLGSELLLGKELGRTAVHARSSARSEHVIIVSIDGLRPDAITKFGAGTIERLMQQGSYSLKASTILPSKTLPSHTSMLTGVEPNVHGVTWNEEDLEDHGHVATPTIFAAAKRAGLHTAAFFSKSKFQYLQVPGTLDYSQAPDGWPGKWSADRTVDDVADYLEEHRPNLLFVHLGEPDFVGHITGWMSAPYGWAVREADHQLADLVEVADRAFGAGNYTLILTADHGGHGRNHGSAGMRDVTIPWIAWGKGVSAGVVLADGIHTTDTAATALWLLGVPAPGQIAGTPVRSAFGGRSTVPTL
jgi:arylsulfatase A-like enzyme